MSEMQRIRDRYRERDASAALTGFWTLRNPVALHLAQERERAFLNVLTQADIDLAHARVLDVGCGMGQELVNLVRWGAAPTGLVGIDLMHERLTIAQCGTSAALVQAGADAMPFADASFDVVCQSVVFSSIVDRAVRQAAAAEMLRVLKPGGWLLWYDAERTRGHDPHFCPVPLPEVRALFPGLGLTYRRLTTDLGLLTRIHAAAGARGMALLDLSGAFKTHVLVWGQKR